MEFHLEKCPDCNQEMRAVVSCHQRDRGRLVKPYRQVCKCGRMVPLLSVADWIASIPSVPREDAILSSFVASPESVTK